MTESVSPAAGRHHPVGLRSRSIARRTLVRAALRIALVVLAASLFGYWHVRSGMEDQALASLQRYVDERRARESQILDAAEASLASLAGAFSSTLASEEAFDALFVRGSEGHWRTRRLLFDVSGVSGFAGKYAELSGTDKRTLLAGIDLLERVGPALNGRFRNAFLVGADNAVAMYWPGEPWALEGSDWSIFAKLALLQGRDAGAVLVTGADVDTTSTSPSWSALYFDYGVNEWVVSVTRPLVQDGRRIAILGHDLLVQDLIDRVVRGDIDGAYNVLLDREGRLIAHPAFMAAIQAHSGAIAIEATGDALLAELHRIARRTGEAGAIVDVDDHDVFVASTQLAGPGWHLMTVFPKAIIASEASDMAWLILLVGFAALVIELIVLSGILRGEVGEPLQALANAADRVRDEPEATFDVAERDLLRADELGRLARAFRTMVDHQCERQDQLVALNAALQRELMQRQHAERELARHRELNALLNTIDYGVLFLDRDLNSRLANEAYQRMWNVPPGFYARPRNLREDMEEARRQGLYQVADQDWSSYVEARLDAIRSGDSPPTELHLNNGLVLAYQCTALPDGGRMLTYFDISDIKRAEIQLRAHLDGMEASMDGMALLDDRGHYTYVNEAHAAVYGFARDAMQERSWRELYDQKQLAAFEENIMPTLARYGRWRGEAIGRRRDGTRFPQDLSLAVTETGGLVCVVRDITERKNRERALDRAVRQAQESNAAKSRFLASMSHELRTPLNAILGFTRIVARRTAHQIDSRQRENLDKIKLSAEQLLGLINDILDIAKIEAGRTEVVAVPYAPALVVDQCVRTIEPLVAPGVELRTDVGDISEGCVGDPDKVRQIVTNLLSNAAKHTRAGRITVHLAVARDRLRIAVDDTGPGIAADALETIFEEFGQATSPGASAAAGTGLGLTISRRLARLMGGDVVVASGLGRGSTFTLDLPWQPVSAAAEETEAAIDG